MKKCGRSSSLFNIFRFNGPGKNIFLVTYSINLPIFPLPFSQRLSSYITILLSLFLTSPRLHFHLSLFPDPAWTSATSCNLYRGTSADGPGNGDSDGGSYRSFFSILHLHFTTRPARHLLTTEIPKLPFSTHWKEDLKSGAEEGVTMG